MGSPPAPWPRSFAHHWLDQLRPPHVRISNLMLRGLRGLLVGRSFTGFASGPNFTRSILTSAADDRAASRGGGSLAEGSPSYGYGRGSATGRPQVGHACGRTGVSRTGSGQVGAGAHLRGSTAKILPRPSFQITRRRGAARPLCQPSVRHPAPRNIESRGRKGDRR